MPTGADPLRGVQDVQLGRPRHLRVEGVPGLPGAPQDDAVLTRKFEMSHVGAGRMLCITPLPSSRAASFKEPGKALSLLLSGFAEGACVAGGKQHGCGITLII